MKKSSADFLSELTRLREAFYALEPELEVTVRDSALDVEAYVVVWNTDAAADGPLGRCGKGGTRISPHVTLQQTRELAQLSTLRNAAAGLPLGGARSGIVGNPDDRNFERQYRRVMELCKPLLIDNGGIFGGFGFEIGARAEHPHWACESLGSTSGFTGKPVEMGGTDYDREGIAGLGVSVAAKELLKHHGKDLKQTTCAIQGVGAMGASVMRYFWGYGAKVTHLSDLRFDGTIYCPDGIDGDLREAIIRQEFGLANELIVKNGYERRRLDEVLYADVDVLFPCAAQRVIGLNNCEGINASYVIEGADLSTSKEAQAVLHKRGVHVIPDFIANPGGIISAFVELTSFISPEENAKTRKNVKDAKAMTESKVEENMDYLIRLSEKYNTELRVAGEYLALRNVLGGSF